MISPNRGGARFILTLAVVTLLLAQIGCGRDETAEPPATTTEPSTSPVDHEILVLASQGDEAFKERAYDVAEESYLRALRYAQTDTTQPTESLERSRFPDDRPMHVRPSDDELRVKAHLAAIGRLIVSQ